MHPMKPFFLLFASCFVYLQSHAQPCYSQDYFRNYLSAHPELQPELEKLNQMVNHAHLSKKGGNVRIIPVVFHVIHEYGSENISKVTITNFMKVLNECYRKQNADTQKIRNVFKPVAADCGIEFRLAQKDPNGKCTEGINRINSSLTNSADESVKKLIWWDNTKYLNIWVVKKVTIFKEGFVGFSHFPGPAGGPPEEDGIVVQSDLFNTTSSKSLVHEIGHWLGLYHTFDDNNCVEGDLVEDTPPEIHTVILSCNPSLNSCTNFGPPYTSDPPDMYENFMDYADMACQNLFTLGQKARMDATLATYRSYIWSDANLAATGVDGNGPSGCGMVADFNMNSEVGCTGNEFNFLDKTYGGTATDYLWSFESADTGTSTLKNPANITWSTPGKYIVRLKVKNASDSNEVTRSIEVLPRQAPKNLPLFMGFENEDIAQDGWAHENAGVDRYSWERNTSYKRSGQASIFIHHYSETRVGEVDAFYSDSYNLTNAVKPTLSFYTAHARRSNTLNDNLRVYVSIDCGATWRLKFLKAGAPLAANVPVSADDYFPLPQDWRLWEYDLSAYKGESNLRFRFETIGNNGNNIFIDDISVQEGSVGMNPLSAGISSFSVIPNPMVDEAEVIISLNQASEISLRIINLLGHEIIRMDRMKMGAGNHSISLNERMSNLPKGVYWITLQSEGNTQISRLVKL